MVHVLGDLPLLSSRIAASSRWISGWFAAPTNRQIVIAVLIVGVLTLLVKLDGTCIGVSVRRGRELDARIIAWVLLMFLINVLGGSLQAAFVPV